MPQLEAQGSLPTKSPVGSRGKLGCSLNTGSRILIKAPETSPKEPGGNDCSLENVQSGQCPILAGATLPYAFLT